MHLLFYSLFSTSNSDLYWFLQLSIDIGTEVKYHNKMLDEMVSFTFGLLSPGEINALFSFQGAESWKNNTLAIKHSMCHILFGCKT